MFWDDEEESDAGLPVDDKAAYAELLKKQKSADDLKGYMGAAGGVLDNFANVGTAHEMLFGGKLNRSKPSEALGAAAKNIADPMERESKAMQYIKAKRENTMATADDDPNSPESLSFANSIESLMPSLKGKLAGKSKSSIKETFPIISAKIQGDNSRENARIASGARADAESARKQERQDKIDAAKEEKAKLSEKQVGELSDLDIAESDLNTLVTSLGKNSEWTGPVDGRVPDYLVGSDQVGWRSDLGKFKDQYRKAITGAGAGPREIEMLEKRLPSETDAYEDFKAKAKASIAALKRQKQIQLENMKKVGKNVSQFEGVAQTPPPGKVEMIDPKGRRKLVAPEDVAAATAAGGRLVGPSVAGQ